MAGPWIVPYPADVAGKIDIANKLQPPSAAHWFGTDEVGNDILTRVIIGARLSLLVGIGITLAAAAIGTPLGILAGTRADGCARPSCASPTCSCRCPASCWPLPWWPRWAPASAMP